MPTSTTERYGKDQIPSKIIKAFGGNNEVISVKMRANNDVPTFVNKLKTAYDKTKENSIQFD